MCFYCFLCYRLADNVLPLLGFACRHADIFKIDYLCYCLAERVLSFLQTFQAFKSLIFLCYTLIALLKTYCLFKALQAFKRLNLLCFASLNRNVLPLLDLQAV